MNKSTVNYRGEKTLKYQHNSVLLQGEGKKGDVQIYFSKSSISISQLMLRLSSLFGLKFTVWLSTVGCLSHCTPRTVPDGHC